MSHLTEIVVVLPIESPAAARAMSLDLGDDQHLIALPTGGAGGRKVFCDEVLAGCINHANSGAVDELIALVTEAGGAVIVDCESADDIEAYGPKEG